MTNTETTICSHCRHNFNRKIIWGAICPNCDSYVSPESKEPSFILVNKKKYEYLRNKAIQQVRENIRRRRYGHKNE